MNVDMAHNNRVTVTVYSRALYLQQQTSVKIIAPKEWGVETAGRGGGLSIYSERRNLCRCFVCFTVVLFAVAVLL